MTDKGIQVLVRSHCGYPARLTELLGEDAPPVLYAAGSLSILDKCSIGIGGSRMASEGGIRLTDKVARGLTRSDINVVSGNAAGVDSAAHFAALDSGGTTTLVLAEGILNFRPKSPIGESLSDGNYVVVSEFLPGTRWAAHNAMQRNRTILGLSACFVAVEPGIDGGTFDASTNALRLGLPLFVLENDGVSANAPGTQHFLSRGAIAIRPGPDGDVDVGTLVSIARRPPETPQPMEAGLLFPGAVKPRARKRA
ncbi:MAG: DNA-processing protein DprA [Phycisphaerales bacterium]